MINLSKTPGFEELARHYDLMCARYLEAFEAYADAGTAERRNLTRYRTWLHKEIAKAAWIERHRA